MLHGLCIQDGECVECIDRGQKCREDSDCCQPFLYCNRQSHLPDGTCETQKDNGDYCLGSSNCLSGFCLKSRGKISGKCADAPKAK